MQTTQQKSLSLHKKYQGKLRVETTVPITNFKELSLAYTPGVAEPCREIAKDVSLAYDLTIKGRAVAIISDGSAVLGLGNIGPEAALPVMEGKAALLKEFAGVDAFPLVINTQDTQEIITFVKQVAPTFAGINLEDISAPRCFEIEAALQSIGIPVFHDDQHGTAIVVSAALRNAAKVVGKKYEDLRVVVVGSGAAGIATAKMLRGIECDPMSCKIVPGAEHVSEVILVDSKGAVYAGRTDLNDHKKMMAEVTNPHKLSGSLADVAVGADVLIGVSQPGLFTRDIIKSMARDPIVFAMANPDPEIMPDEAKKAGAAIVATGRSDFPNQINNVLAFPGVFRAVIDGRLSTISNEMKQAAATALAEQVLKPSATNIIPDAFTPNLAKLVSVRMLESIN